MVIIPPILVGVETFWYTNFAAILGAYKFVTRTNKHSIDSCVSELGPECTRNGAKPPWENTPKLLGPTVRRFQME